MTTAPRELGPGLLQRARTKRPDRAISVVLAKAEYEAWFLAAGDSIAGQQDIAGSITPPPDPESIRDAKGWLSARMPPGQSYRPTLHQPKLTAVFDLDSARGGALVQQAVAGPEFLAGSREGTMLTSVPKLEGSTPAGSTVVRKRFVEALNLDLIGPGAGHELASERLPGWVRPSNWYLTGFLVPAGAPPAQSGDADEDDDLDEMPASAGLVKESTEERKAVKMGLFPSSMGLSFLVPEEADTVAVSVRRADHALVPVRDAGGKPASVWQREQKERTEQSALAQAYDYPLADGGGLSLHSD